MMCFRAALGQGVVAAPETPRGDKRLSSPRRDNHRLHKRMFARQDSIVGGGDRLKSSDQDLRSENRLARSKEAVGVNTRLICATNVRYT